MENLKELIDVTNALIFALKIDGRKDKANTELIKEAERIVKLCNMPVVSGSDLLKYGKKTKTKKENTDCDECKYKDGSNKNACFYCPDKNGFGYHYR